MRHATPAALDQLEPFLNQLREVPGLRERKQGIFYRGSKAFLHFHEDDSGMHADVRIGADFDRFRVESPEERDRVLTLIRSL